MQKILSLFILAIITTSVFAQKPDTEYVKEISSYYSEVNPSVFRDARRVLRKGFMKDYTAYGQGVKDGKGSSKKISVSRFENALEIETHDVFYNDWDVEVGSPCDFPILENDLLYVTFWIKCLGSRDESNQGYTRVYLQQNGPPWQKSADVNVVAGSEWIQYKIPFRAQYQNYDSKQAAVAFAMGYSHQKMQIADVKVTNLGTYASEEDLPKTKFSYDGREEGAQWRKDAEARIEKNRKGDLTVVVKNKKGEVVPNANVKVEMTKHEFGFGNIVNRSAFGNPGPKGQAYRKIVKENFNQVTFENALKHDMWLLHKSEGRTDKTFEAIDSLDSWDIDVRGHAMVWPATRYTTSAKYFVEKDDKAGLKSFLEGHIKEVATATKGRVVDWDVMNEPYINHKFMDMLGDDVVSDWFKLARENEPDADLYINETRFLIDGGVNRNVQDNLYKWVEKIRANNVEINGLGFQGHFGETALTSPEKILEILNRFQKLDVKIKITELDIQTDDEELQADYLTDFYTLIYSHPSTNAIISWGFWEDYHWRPSAAWFRSDFSIKPVGEAHRDLVYNKWWTDVDGKTASNGNYKTRGFCGDYRITAEVNGKSVTQTCKLTNKGTSVEVIVK